ncbi:MAG TPA: hypothetical protein VKZ87_02110 [Ferrovibrio sp.]|jgi:hypothetical protein|uniref:hypothetical protein n=1 Tax=Ferrovibrio sp. TaxID=1917215 RepID=UPI002B4AB68C|nr:hypothetical protein [Ferrovibrio sp.]HLT76156.1 hypothetical protein [Ferrovibrio sp.]
MATRAFILRPLDPYHSAWKDSTYSGTCLVYAASEEEARMLAWAAYAAKPVDADEVLDNPWDDPDLVICKLMDINCSGLRGVVLALEKAVNDAQEREPFLERLRPH